MVSTTTAGDTDFMLLQDNMSLGVGERQTVRLGRVKASYADEVPVTVAVREALERDLSSLRAEQREIPARLRTAREFGDTANNDEHLAIREEEAVLAARIAQLEDILLRAAVVERDGADDSVAIGCSVSVVDVETDEKFDYVIGSAHGVLSRGTVSALSPVGLDRHPLDESASGCRSSCPMAGEGSSSCAG